MIKKYLEVRYCEIMDLVTSKEVLTDCMPVYVVYEQF